MADFETENVVVKETLAQVQGKMNLFQGNMETIMEYLQTQKVVASANPASDVVTNANVVTTTAGVVATVETPVEIVVPSAMDHPMFTFSSNKLVDAYPWGMPLNFASQFANGGVFIPHQAFASPTTIGNSAFPWGVPMVQTPQTVDVANPENTQGQVLFETPDDDAEYRGSRLHFHIPSQAAQYANPNLYQANQFSYPGETFISMLPYAPANPAF